MPRIEIKPAAHPKGEPTPTVDVCMDCVEVFVEGDTVPNYLANRHGSKAVVVTIGCEHPPYSGEDYACDRCGEQLTDADNDADHGTIEVVLPK